MNKTVIPIGSIKLLRISHKHGDNYCLCLNDEEINKNLYSYVAQGWDSGLDEQYGSLEKLSPAQAIDAYFEAWGDGFDPEFYEIIDDLGCS